MRALTWVCALLLLLAPVSESLAQSATPKPSARRKKKPRATKPKPADKPTVTPPAAAPPAVEPEPAEDDGSGPQWETEDEEAEKEKEAAAKLSARNAERARLAEEKRRAAAADQARLEETVKWRRTMLTVHQGVGVATWLALAGTTVLGQLELNDKYRSGSADPDRLEKWHFGFAIGSTALFATTGLMGLLAPRAYNTRSGGFSTVTLHKILVSIATAGMLAQVGLGLLAHTLEGSLDQKHVVQAHQLIGYGTLGALTVGAAVLVF